TVARDEGTDWVLVGHNRDDQAETVLLHLARGAGLDGASGMRELSRRPVALDLDDLRGMPIRLLRPLLQVPRADLSAYALAHGLSPIEDPSNRSTVFRRNAVRHGVIPSLEQATAGGAAALARSAALLRDDADLLAVLAEEAAAEVLVDDRGLVLVSRAALRRLHVSLQRRVLRLALTRIGLGQPPALERLEALREAALAGKVSTRLDLGCGFAARVDYREVALAPDASLDALLRRASAWPLLAPGTGIAVTGPLDLGLGNGWRLGLRPDGEASSVWTLRTRQPADRLVAPDGSAVRLQDWLVNRKVPEYLRDWLPLLARDGTVRWVGGAGGGKQRVHGDLCVFLRRDDPGGA
ncbi:MAG TPA: tRNA lysidine(34) synthetase, partial [Thermomicrobiaceae bacterium]|nr:tRNA lysidine(34) synthetase [Thermomicrobiaceae bacterium]